MVELDGMLSIVMPAYNEEKLIYQSIMKTLDIVSGFVREIELIAVNDGSKDNTVEVAKKWGVHHVVNFTQNKGLAKGFMAGLDECLRQGADIIVNTDADNVAAMASVMIDFCNFILGYPLKFTF